VATEATIERTFDRLRVVHRPYFANEADLNALLDEWIAHLTEYSEAAVLDAAEALVLVEKWPTLAEAMAAVQKAARDIKAEAEWVWGREHPEADPTNVDEAGRKRLVGLMMGVLQKAGTQEHNHRNGAAGCPICGVHDHSDGSAYCPACAFDDEGIVIGDPGKVTYLCREGCDPKNHLIEVWVDERNVPLPKGVMGKTMAVKPCPRCAPDTYEAWQKGIWGEQAGRKGKAKGVNATPLG
jgi:hypothetical protein